MSLAARAPAKINLSLHVLGRRPDGYHELESLVAFAGASDLLTLTPGKNLSLQVGGPTAGHAGPDDDNLVTRAARALMSRKSGLRTGAFHLTKRLPVAGGVGGGSSDAGAALRLLAQHNGLSLTDSDLVDAARQTGSDVPVCVEARARMMCGAGETLGPLLALPPLFAVLVNPGVAVETRRVFAELGLCPGEDLARRAHTPINDGLSTRDLLHRLQETRNDLEAPARRVAPVISDVVDALAGTGDCLLARMSGSGATCFGLFATCHQAARAAAHLRVRHPNWWIKPTALR